MCLADFNAASTVGTSQRLLTPTMATLRMDHCPLQVLEGILTLIVFGLYSFQSQTNAQAQKLAYVNDKGNAVIKVDNTTVGQRASPLLSLPHPHVLLVACALNQLLTADAFDTLSCGYHFRSELYLHDVVGPDSVRIVGAVRCSAYAIRGESKLTIFELLCLAQQHTQISVLFGLRSISSGTIVRFSTSFQAFILTPLF